MNVDAVTTQLGFCFSSGDEEALGGPMVGASLPKYSRVDASGYPADLDDPLSSDKERYARLVLSFLIF